MKTIFLFTFLLTYMLPLTAQNKSYVSYSDFGAVGDGVTDDTEAIAAAHAYANEHHLPVKAGEGNSFYIGGKDKTIIIKTDTDFGTASFIIDDTDVENRQSHVFLVASGMQPVKSEALTSLKKNQEKVDIPLSQTSVITVTNSHKKQYIRLGPNQNSGYSQTDIFIADKNGNVNMDAPIIWDFDSITTITILPVDDKTLTITGGQFTTIANKAASRYTYYNRGIAIRRSNTVVDGLKHYITGEGEHGAPYGGFINISECVEVIIQNSIFTGHKTYHTIGSAGVSVPMGTYDISLNRALNVSFINCNQSNNIRDSRFWGIMGSNYCKNIILDNCTFSRFDAHMGVVNATIRNSTLGHQGINAIGSGTFLLENSIIFSRNLINLRSDYGSTWQGKLIIRNCDFVPPGGRTATLISGDNRGQHDFGYTCYLPEQIIIENLFINDFKYKSDYPGPAIFSSFNPAMTDETYREKYPYVRNSNVRLKNVTTVSGKSLRLSDHPFMFREVTINDKKTERIDTKDLKIEE